MSPLAGVNDVTAEVVAVLGALPSSETAVQVAELVIEARLEGVDADPTVVLVDGPHSGGDRLTDITYDIIGFYDDAVRGERVHIFTTPPDIADGPMTLFSVEATTICARGDGTGELCP